MYNERPVTPILAKHTNAWKTCWDFLGGNRSWDEALKRFNAAKKAEKKAVKEAEAALSEETSSEAKPPGDV